MRRLVSCLLPLTLLAGCAGYAIDYVKPRPSLIAQELERYGLEGERLQCVSDRLASALTVWQLRQLADVAGGAAGVTTERLSPGQLVAVSSRVTDPQVQPVVSGAVAACGAWAQVAPEPAETTQIAPATPPADSAQASPSGPSPWVNLGAATSGQAIAVEAATVRQEGGVREAWFRLTDPGQVRESAVAYRLRIDCAARTINPMAFRQYGPEGDVVAQREYGPAGEGAMAVETGTVMEIAYLALCT